MSEADCRVYIDTLSSLLPTVHVNIHTQFEADRRAFIITINSFGTELTMDDREKLYPTCGKLFPEGLARLAKCEDYDQVKGVADCYPVSLSLHPFTSLRVLTYTAPTLPPPPTPLSPHPT